MKLSIYILIILFSTVAILPAQLGCVGDLTCNSGSSSGNDERGHDNLCSPFCGHCCGITLSVDAIPQLENLRHLLREEKNIYLQQFLVTNFLFTVWHPPEL